MSEFTVDANGNWTKDGRPGRFVWLFDDESSVVVVGDAFAHDSPREQQRQARKLIADARGKNVVIPGDK